MANFHLTYRNSNRSGQIDHAETLTRKPGNAGTPWTGTSEFVS
jgi:hypothetical protein